MMSTHDRLLTNTTNRLTLEHEEQSQSTNSSRQSILMPTPIHPPKELPFLAKREQFLQQQIAEAKEEQ